MKITEKTVDELESRIEKLENLIEEQGLGSEYLDKAKKIQRNLNLSLLVGGAISVAGILAWALKGK